MLPYPQRTSAFCMEGGRSRPGPSSSPAQLSLCPPPLPAADGARAPAANLARRCQPQAWQTTSRREEDLLAGRGDPPPLAIELQTLGRPHSRTARRSLPRSLLRSQAPNLLVCFISLSHTFGSRPPATVTGAGTFAYLHMQIITFAYGAPPGRLRVSRLAVCPAPSLSLPVAKGWGGGRAGGVRPPGLASSVPGGFE